MVNVTIDGVRVSVEENTTIMDAAAAVGVRIPRLCYLKDINEIAACRVCLVEVDGHERLLTSCNNTVTEGMVIHTNSPRVRQARRTNVQLILSQHDCRCAVCVRSGNCSLQQLANDMGCIGNPYGEKPETSGWNMGFPLIRDNAKCIKCMRCIQICDKVQNLGVWDVMGTGSRTTVNVASGRKIEAADCSLCDQCITHCPVAALRERDDTDKVLEALLSGHGDGGAGCARCARGMGRAIRPAAGSRDGKAAVDESASYGRGICF
ncbi:MAG: 2Fe-2S iron-sulfur cluster-binding protein [Christensenellales bacterium]